MLITTKDLMFPTTVTGSWPRPRWFDKSLCARTLSDAMTDVDYREKFLDAVDAKAILASNDRTLSGKQRAFDRLVGDRPFLRTHNSGAITVTIGREGKLSVSTFLH